jgi:hypothetical protein
MAGPDFFSTAGDKTVTFVLGLRLATYAQTALPLFVPNTLSLGFAGSDA